MTHVDGKQGTRAVRQPTRRASNRAGRLRASVGIREADADRGHRSAGRPAVPRLDAATPTAHPAAPVRLARQFVAYPSPPISDFPTRGSRRRLTAIELFSGAGGMTLGFEQAGFDVLAAVDLDPVHLAAHERNFPLCEPLCEDIADARGADVLSAARRGWARRSPQVKFAGPVDCIFGGPSCQGFSVIGRRDANDPRNALVAEFARIVGEIRPRWFVLENVPGLVTSGYRHVLDAFYRDMEKANYDVTEPWRLNARDYGVPQERKRIFIVGARADELLPAPPPENAESPTVAEALSDLSMLGRFSRLFSVDHLNLTQKQLTASLQRQTAYVRRLNGQPPDGRDLSDPRLWDQARLTSVGLTRHRKDVLARFRDLGAGDRDETGRLPRLRASGKSPTLRAGTGRDHGSFTSARPVHYSSDRVITVREAARLHGFPDWFRFHATKWHGFRQVGNAVPPPLARAVAAQVVGVSGETPERRADPVTLGGEALLLMPLSEAADHHGLDASRLPADVRRAELVAKEAA